jgi:hypothetical protein
MSIFPSSGRRRSLAGVLGVLLASAATLTALTQPASADGTVLPGNKNCSDLVAGAQELRVEPPASGTFSSGGFSVQVVVRTLTSDLADHAGNQTGSQVFDFTATGGSVLAVAVKGGPDTNFYDYRPAGTSSGSTLHAPINTNKKFYGLSHISFCYVPKASPTISTQVSAATVTIGSGFSDTATLAGGNNPTGSITFNVYGPDDATCSGAVAFTDTVPVTGNGSYDSAVFTPSAVGKYRWIASYSGDAANNAVTGQCNDANEDTTVQQAEPTIATQVSQADVTIGDSFRDTATLAGGHNPTGSITFNVYGPDDATCSGDVAFTDTVTVNGNGDYPSALFTPDVVGKYRWIASYSGDADNKAVSGACNDANEDTTVDKAQPSIGTTPDLLPNDAATLAGLVDPSGGTLTFKLFANADCSGDPIYTKDRTVDANGTFVTDNTTVTVTDDATINWVVHYAGDDKNKAVTSTCGNEQVVMDFTVN